MLKKLVRLYLRLPFRFYLSIGLGFVIWMLFFDTNDWVRHYQLRGTLDDLKDEKAYYLKGIKTVEKDIRELTTDKELLEKYAREKYLMKKPTEDLYVIEYKD